MMNDAPDLAAPEWPDEWLERPSSMIDDHIPFPSYDNHLDGAYDASYESGNLDDWEHSQSSLTMDFTPSFTDSYGYKRVLPETTLPAEGTSGSEASNGVWANMLQQQQSAMAGVGGGAMNGVGPALGSSISGGVSELGDWSHLSSLGVSGESAVGATNAMAIGPLQAQLLAQIGSLDLRVRQLVAQLVDELQPGIVHKQSGEWSFSINQLTESTIAQIYALLVNEKVALQAQKTASNVWPVKTEQGNPVNNHGTNATHLQGFSGAPLGSHAFAANAAAFGLPTMALDTNAWLMQAGSAASNLGLANTTTGFPSVSPFSHLTSSNGLAPLSPGALPFASPFAQLQRASSAALPVAGTTTHADSGASLVSDDLLLPNKASHGAHSHPKRASLASRASSELDTYSPSAKRVKLAEAAALPRALRKYGAAATRSPPSSPLSDAYHSSADELSADYSAPTSPCSSSSGTYMSGVVSHATNTPRANFLSSASSAAANASSSTTVNADEGLFSCNHCQRCYPGLAALNKHMRVHHDERHFSCSHPGCNKRFSHSSTLKDHMNIHFQRKPYICKECGKGFPNGSNLNRHARIHTKSKPYVCPVCNKAFSQSSNLRVHQKIHDRPPRFPSSD